MGHEVGDPIRGFVNSADASAGVEVAIFKMGSQTAHVLLANEYIVITDIQIVSAAGGDIQLFFDTDNDNALDAGEEIFRGTVAANGGIAQRLVPAHPGPAGSLVHIDAPAGAVDVAFQGFIRNEGDNTGARPSYRESQTPGA